MGKCIYCSDSQNLTKSHIVPECLGSNLILKNAVCKKCNYLISKIESKICDDLSFYRVITGIKGKRKLATTKAEMNVPGHKIPIKVRADRVIEYVRPIIEDGPPRYFNVYAQTKDKLIEMMQQFSKMEIEFNAEKISEVEVQVIFEGELIKINSMDFLRLAAKIAFESFCLRRLSQAFDIDLNPVREFISKGKVNSEPIAFLIFDEELVKILDIPFPFHGILLYGFNNQIESIISIFGLFYYYIILNKNASLVQDWDEFIYIDPKNKKHSKALYFSDPFFPLLKRLIEKSKRDKNVFKNSTRYAREKFNLFLKQFQKK